MSTHQTFKPIWEKARGRWYGILPAMGIDRNYLTGKAGPCPMCGGKDRFTFDDKQGNGTYICRNCGAGTGVQFVQKFCGVEFKEAARLIDEQIGSSPITYSQPAPSADQQHEAMNALWLSSVPVTVGDPVHAYLMRRLGEIVVSPDIRFVERCRYPGSKPSYHPAMVAMVRNSAGNPCQIHRTYLTDDGHKAAVECPRRVMAGDHPKGSAVRLLEAGDVLGVAEGIETAFAAQKLFDVPVWAALTASRLELWEPPKQTRYVIIFADNDRSFAGLKAAACLAYRLARRLAVEIRQPPAVGDDWNDHWMRQKPPETIVKSSRNGDEIAPRLSKNNTLERFAFDLNR
ncbi:MAG: P4 alpha zinc-binding domain protein [Hyphomicrobiales bacterium]|nr:P4 alpha zinc-binding domain protein [Hyphomicrobiales bacterium]